MANREEHLAKNTLLFALGNFGSKMLQIILVPFYTRFLIDAQYGTADIMQAVVSLLVPIASLTVAESVFRYAMEKEYNKSAVLSVGVAVTGLGALMLCLMGMVLSLPGLTAVVQRFFPGMAVDTRVFIWLIIANTITNALRTLISQYTRAIGRTGLFALDNVVLTAVVLVLNIVFIALLGMGVTGYMLGYTLANLFSAVFLILSMGKQFRLDFGSVHRGLTCEMLLFSLPLIPNSVCWWISSFLDRVMILSMVSAAANGLYAAAHKIPSLLSVIMSVFFQAWQVSANEEFRKKDIAEFYGIIFNQISACMFVLAAVLIMFSRPINTLFLGARYYDAWQFMPPLVLSTVFFSYAQFLGSIYSANKKTKMAFVTNFVGVLVSVTLNLLLIPLLGALGAAIANASSYLVLWLVRTWDTGKIVPIQYRVKQTVFATLIVAALAFVVCMDWNLWLSYGCCAGGICVLVGMFRNELVGTVRFCFRFARKILRRR